MDRNCWKWLLLHSKALWIALLITAIVSAGWLDDLDYKASDKLYQRQGKISADIVVVGVDSKTLSKLGPVSSWIRRDMSKAITRLNEASPAAIGIDFLFTGENPEAPEFDRQLAETVAKYDNVVFASAAIVDEEDEENPHEIWNKTWQWDSPFPALAEATATGHICEPYDEDGIIRHQLLYINVTERGRLYSFARVIYEKSCQAKGISPKPPPTTESNGLYYLPFTSKSYDNISFVDLLEGKISADFFRDKIVLIGSLAPGMGDEFSTALDKSSSVYGVDIHANAIQAFEENFFPHEVGRNIQLIVLFLVSFISAVFFRTGKIHEVLIAWSIIFFGWFGVCKIFYHNALILHALWIPLAVSVLFVGSITINYTLARAERDKVTSTFGRYVDPTIMRQLLSGSGEALDVGGTLRNIAVLFVDIRGFTTLSEKLPAPTVVEILNQYLTLTTECIRRHHGTLDKFVGDCTMAFWNAPLTQDKPVLLACRAAVDMIKGSEKLKAELKSRYGCDIAFGVGIHWGSAVVGNIGSPFRMDYTAIGDTVNTAARLEANAPGGKIFISRVVADILGTQAEVTSLGDTIKLKGKASGFEVLILDSLKEME